MTYAEQVGIARRAIIKKAADAFEASGTEYTCRKVVQDYALPHIEAALLNAQSLTAHRSFKPINLQRDVADEIHKRWKAKQGT